MPDNAEPTTTEKFLEAFYEYISFSIDEKGLYPQPAWREEEREGKTGITVESLALPPEQILEHGVKARYTSTPPHKIVFGLDRTTREGQGTTLGDVFTFWYWERGMDHWRTGIIEYQHDPRIIKPINWDNEFWNKKMTEEIERCKPILMPWHDKFDPNNGEHVEAFVKKVLDDAGDDPKEVEKAKELAVKAIVLAASKDIHKYFNKQSKRTETTVDPPERVGAILEDDGKTVKFLGYGNYVGDKIPANDPQGFPDFHRPNPKIVLDNGKVVWGCQCWWGSEARIKQELEGKEIIMAGIEEIREEKEDA